MGCHLSKRSSTTKVTAAGNNHQKKHERKVEHEAEASRLILELQPSNSGSTLPEQLEELLLNDPNLLLFLTNAVSTKKILASFKLGISRARGMQEIILQALKFSQNEDENSRALTLHKLREFKEAGDPFDGLIFTDEFSSPSEHLQSTVKHLNSRRNEIKRKLALTKKWKKVWKVLHNVVFVSVLVCAVLLAAVSAPPLATIAATAGSTVIKTAEPWLDSIWADRLDALKREKDVVLMAMNRNNMFGVHELESIRAMLKRLEIKIGSVSYSAGFALANQEVKDALKMAMDDIEPKVGEIGKWIDEVEMKVTACEVETGKAVAEFLNAIINDF